MGPARRRQRPTSWKAVAHLLPPCTMRFAERSSTIGGSAVLLPLLRFKKQTGREAELPLAKKKESGRVGGKPPWRGSILLSLTSSLFLPHLIIQLPPLSDRFIKTSRDSTMVTQVLCFMGVQPSGSTIVAHEAFPNGILRA